MDAKTLRSFGLNIAWAFESWRWWGIVLKGEKRHYCFEWDFLPIDETCSEFECCKNHAKYIDE